MIGRKEIKGKGHIRGKGTGESPEVLGNLAALGLQRMLFIRCKISDPLFCR
jgi:hypothetical protein